MLYRDFEQSARKAEISIAQYRLLLFLRNGPKRAGEIAAAAEIAKPTVSLALNALRDKGLIENAPDPDGRASPVVITETGRARMRAIEEQFGDVLAGVFNPGELADLSTALEKAYVALAKTKDRRLEDVERQFRG